MVSKSGISAARVFTVLNYVLSGVALLIAFSFLDKTGMFEFSDAHMTSMGGLLALLFLVSIPLSFVCFITSIGLLIGIRSEKKTWRGLLISFLVFILCVCVYLFVGMNAHS